MSVNGGFYTLYKPEQLIANPDTLLDTVFYILYRNDGKWYYVGKDEHFKREYGNYSVDDLYRITEDLYGSLPIWKHVQNALRNGLPHEGGLKRAAGRKAQNRSQRLSVRRPKK